MASSTTADGSLPSVGSVTNNVNVNYLSAASYNTTGWNIYKADFVNTLLLTFSLQFLAIQEHFRLKDNLSELDCFKDYEVFSIPAFKNNDTVHNGRPSGGLSLIYSHDVSQFVTRITCPNSFRVQGLKINFPGDNFLVINTYFPNDPRSNNIDESELLDTLNSIKYLLDHCGEDYKVILMGDLNTDFSRNTTFVQIVKNFLIENNLTSTWDKFECDFTYYHERRERGRTIVSKSTIDHCCVNNDTLDSCVEGMPLHFSDNLSCHAPVFLKIACDRLYIKDNPVSDKDAKIPKPQWHKASSENISNYSQTLNDLINNVVIDSDMLYCRDVKCTNKSHLDRLDMLSEDVMDCISKAVQETIPHSNSTKEGFLPVPGWKDVVKPYKDQSLFWGAVWKSAGRPIDTELHKVMRHTRNKYHYAIRQVKNHEAQLRKSKFVDACLNNDVNDILKDIRESRSSNSTNAKVVDGCSTKPEIAENFKNIYNSIYNTHNDKEEVQKFIEENDLKICQSDRVIVDSISPEMIKRIILRLSDNKNDSSWDWKSNALKLGADSLSAPMCDLICAMLIHGHIPKIFLLCNLIPIIKNKNESKLTSSNYRLIAISSLLLKVFDHVFMELSIQNLKPDFHQFGFQSGLSTTMCTWSLTESINFFRNRGGSVFLCLMDLTKAFDHVKFGQLFKKMDGKVAPILLRCLVFSYLNQVCQVVWSGCKSSTFSICNGVRQGAVLSPTLFNYYINDVFLELCRSGFGCVIDELYFGCWGYADDIALLAPCREALQKMISICDRYFSDHGIFISTNDNVNKTKTKVITFGVEGKIAPLMLGNRPLPTVDQWPHLGVSIDSNESLVGDLEDKRRSLIGKIFALQQELGNQDPNVFMKLVSIYLLNLFGCVLWDIYATSADKLWTAWQRLVRSTFSLPMTTHTWLLNDIVGGKHLKKIIKSRFIKFSESIRSSDNPYIRLLDQYQRNDWRSSYGRNVMNLCHEAGVENINDVDVSSLVVNPVPEQDEWRVNLMADLLSERNNNSRLLSEEEVCHMINFVCTS